jgi:hypothetical protein
VNIEASYFSILGGEFFVFGSIFLEILFSETWTQWMGASCTGAIAMLKTTRELCGSARQLAARHKVREPFTAVTTNPATRVMKISVYDGRTGVLAGTVTPEDIRNERWCPTTLASCGGYIPPDGVVRIPIPLAAILGSH